MDLRDFYKEHYALEVARRHELTGALTLPLGVLSLLVGGLVVIAKEIHAPLDGWKIFQLIALTASFIAVATTTYFLIRSYFNYAYGYVPTPKEIRDYREKLVAYYVSMRLSNDAASKKADKETLEYIDTEYATHAHRNIQNNDTKSAYLHKANGALILSMIFTVAAGLPHLAGSIAAPPAVQKIEVVNVKEAVMTNSSGNSSNSQQQNTQQQTTQQQTTTGPAQEKPLPPPGRVIKEHVDVELKSKQSATSVTKQSGKP